MKVKVLIVDDHPSMIEGYKVILSYNSFGYEPEFDSAFDCETAYKLLKKNVYDVVFLDYSLPAYEEESIQSGADLGKILRKLHPTTKIVILTSHSEAILLYDLINSINPEGVLVKSDFTADDLQNAFDKILNGQIYKSITADKAIKELISKDTYLDTHNRKIITLLAEGIKTKNLPQYINLSISAIEKRKMQIKIYFGIEKGNDEDILREAKKMGLL